MPYLFGAIQRRLNQPLNRRTQSGAFFMDVIPVPPSRFRPANKLNDKTSQHPQNVYYGRILALNKAFVERLQKKKGTLPRNFLGNFSRVLDSASTPQEWLRTLQTNMEIQFNVNCLFDNKLGPTYATLPAGVCQILEKKEGLFRFINFFFLLC
jgi:DNA-directed RNA polymerase I subunit RPA1